MKKLLFIQRSQGAHWVGDGFPVHTLFSYNDIAEQVSPFLLLDHAGPVEFPPTTQRRGVSEHPHRGFETVTIVYDGEVEHRDSSGGGGVVGPGDVQWMTAAAGLVHEEFHTPGFARRGGKFEMAQLWVNLPAKDKRAAPAYQGLRNAQIPRVDLPDDAGSLRVIAGEYAGHRGPARTFSPINVWDLRVKAGRSVTLSVPESFTTAIVVLSGQVRLPEGETVNHSEMAVLAREGTQFNFTTVTDATLLILNGQPLNEPIVGYGPFVMNTREEIQEAFVDFQSGRMGRLKVVDRADPT
jgi:redox-sensitive bicupin YhaK (pirin superfamily)